MRDLMFFKNHDLIIDPNNNYTYYNDAGFKFDLKHHIQEGGIYKQE